MAPAPLIKSLVTLTAAALASAMLSGAPAAASNAAPTPDSAPSPVADATDGPIESASPTPSASPSPSQSPTASPSPSESPTASPSPSESPTAEPTNTSDPEDRAECDDVASVTTCPPTPEITSVTALSDSISIGWEWPQDLDVDNQPASVLVRVQPGDVEIVIDGQNSTVIDELQPATQYTIELLGMIDGRLGTSSTPRLIATLDAPTSKPRARPGEIETLIVNLVDEADTEGDAERAAEDLSLSGVGVEEVQDLGTTTARVSLTEGVSTADAEVLMEDLAADPRVASVELDQRVYLQAFPTDPPDDPYWTSGSLWGLYGSYGIGIASDKTSMNSVWSSNQGSGAVVAVLDTGSTSHTDLNASYVTGYDFVLNRTGYCRTGVSDSDGDYVNTSTYGALGWDSDPSDPGDWTTVNTRSCGYAASSSWHGTHVAGTVAARANNTIGITGVAPQASIQPIRVLSYDGGYTSDITTAIKWASGETISGVPANSTPADVINLSLGGSGTCTSTWQEAIDAAVSNGSVVVVSAGNSSTDASNFVPANCNNVITVASSTSSGNLSSFSNYGNTVEVTAPGSGIYSTWNNGSTEPTTQTYASKSGTSMAAPHVAGVAALIKAADSSQTPAQVLATIQSNALTFPSTGSIYDCTTSTCGSGLLRASATTTPSIVSISPSQGAVVGGESITITGSNMGTATSVTLGGTAGTITAQTTSTLTVTTPAHTSGAVDVTVTNPDGSGTSSSGFRYFDAPVATSADVASGSTAGGTQVVITGTNLAPSDVQDSTWIDVTFGGRAATVWLVTTTSVTVTTPSASAGTVDIVVSTAGGSSTLSSAFTYVAPVVYTPPPASSGGGGGGGGAGGWYEIQGLGPTSGPLSGGTTITITGYLSSATGVMFGNMPAASTTVVSDSTITAVSPPATSPGPVDVTVLFPAHVGPRTWINAFTYTGVAAVTAASPGTSSGAVTVAAPVTAPSTSPDTAAAYLSFKGSSAKLSKGMRTKLANIAGTFAEPDSSVTIIGYTNAKRTKKSVANATKRASAVKRYLVRAGFDGTANVDTAPAPTKAQARGTLVFANADPSPTSQVQSIIVQYKAGKSPTVNGQLRGASYVSGGLADSMSVGPNLGLRMYLLNFAEPVSPATAQRVADQLAKDPGIAFAEPDSLVQATPSVGIRSFAPRQD